MNKQPKVIINADDFGYSQGVNAGICKAYTDGILTSTTSLGNMLHGTENLKDIQNTTSLPKPSLSVGVHLNLTLGKPSRPDLWKIAEFSRPNKGSNSPDEWRGSVWETYFSRFSKDAIREEFLAQIQKVTKVLGQVDHLDSHHSVAGYGHAREAYEVIAQELSLPVRPLAVFSEKDVYGGEFVVEKDYASYARSKNIKTVDSVDMSYYYMEKNPIDAFCEVLSTIQPGEVREFMFHPAVDEAQGSWRMVDLQILTSPKVLQTIKNLKIQLTTYPESAY